MVKRPAKKHLQSIPIEAMQSVSVPCDDKFSDMMVSAVKYALGRR